MYFWNIWLQGGHLYFGGFMCWFLMCVRILCLSLMLLPQMRQANPMAQGLHMVAMSVSRSSSGRSTKSGQPNWRSSHGDSRSLCRAALDDSWECAFWSLHSYRACCRLDTCTAWGSCGHPSCGSSSWNFSRKPFRRGDKQIQSSTVSLLLPSMYRAPCSHHLEDRSYALIYFLENIFDKTVGENRLI